jgi:hypothetical protein
MSEWRFFANNLQRHYSSQEDIWYKINVDSPDNVQTAYKVSGWLPISVLPLTAVACRNLLPPWVFMWILSFAIYLSLKWLTWWRARSRIAHAAWRSVAYLLAWPGMDADAFLDARQHVSPPATLTWLWATFETILGAILLWVVARSIPLGQLLLRGWVGMVGLILLLHFGTFQIVALLWQNLGVKAEPIMSAPLHSTSLGEFWGKRWNLGFRQLAHELIFRPLYRRLGAYTAGFLVFAVSGLTHDLVISLPARGGYGLPSTSCCKAWESRSSVRSSASGSDWGRECAAGVS